MAHSLTGSLACWLAGTDIPYLSRATARGTRVESSDDDDDDMGDDDVSPLENNLCLLALASLTRSLI